MDDGQKTPCGHPDFHSYVKMKHVFIYQTEVSCFSITLFYSTLLALTHRQNHRPRNKYTRCAWAGGFFFQLCCCVSFLFWREIGFGFTHLRILLNKLFYKLIFFLIVVEVLAMFFGGFLRRSNYYQKKGTVIWPLVGINLR
jgi:hypothetical protein